MKIIEILKLRKYIKSIDNNIKVRIGKVFECDTDRMTVWLPLKNDKQSNAMFKAWYENHFNETLSEKDLLYISALHEVGHIMTWTQELEDERTEKYNLMQVAHNYQLMSTQELNRQYFEIPMELIATEWGRNYYKNI